MGKLKKATFDIGRAGCLNCKLAIEHAGRHIDGIEETLVDIGSHKIFLTYDESKGQALDALKEYVRQIGYKAELVKLHD